MSQKVRYISEDHLITRQNRAEREFLAAFKAEQPTFAAPKVVVNPYLINPLCALVMFTTPTAVAPTLTVHGKRYERENLTHTFKAATEHFLPVLGLYEDFTNTVTVSLPGGGALVDWSEGGVATMHGPANEVYRGIIDWTRFD